MALLGLNLSGLLSNVTNTLNQVLGGGLGNLVGNTAPTGLIEDLGETINDALGSGDPTGLLEDLLDSGLLNVADLQNILRGLPNGDLDLGELDALLRSEDLAGLKSTLDDIFDTTGLLGLGDTILDQQAIDQLGPVDLESTSTFVTGLVGTIIDTAGGLTNTGSILDTLLAGDDVVAGDAGANELDGGAGNDSISGLGGSDTLWGGAENDTIRGGEGDDRLFGEAGADQLFGDAGTDILNGGAGADTMRGGAGDDTYYVDSAADVVAESASQGVDTVYSSIKYALGAHVENVNLTGTANINAAGNSLDNKVYGNDGVNKLSGGAGRDALYGRGGADVLQGGADADVFRYAAVSDSTLDKAGRDIILDFQKGDRIDLRNIDADTGMLGDQAFQFIGSKQFSVDGDGEVRFSKGSNFTLVSVDVDGNGSLDMAIQLNGHHNLTAADFLL